MGGLVEGLFGSKKSTSTTAPVDVTRPEFRALGGQAAGTLGQLLSGAGGPVSTAGVPAFTGPFTAPLQGAEQGALGALQTTALDPARANLLTQTLGGTFLPGQAGGNPFLEATIGAAARPIFQGLEQTLGRTLPGAFTAAGQQLGAGGLRGTVGSGTPSSAFDLAAARAIEGAGQPLADIATRIGSEAFGLERGLMNQAVALQQADIGAMLQNLQAQGLPRMIEQAGIEGGRNEFTNVRNALLQGLLGTAGFPISVVGQQGTATGTQTPGLLGGISGLFGSANAAVPWLFGSANT